MSGNPQELNDDDLAGLIAEGVANHFYEFEDLTYGLSFSADPMEPGTLTVSAYDPKGDPEETEVSKRIRIVVLGDADSE